MIVYASRTGNVRNVVSRLENIKCVDLSEIGVVNSPYFIFTYTDGIGLIPSKVEEFLDNNKKYIKGVIATGNTNFGKSFCLCADKISEKYKVPIIAKLELRGSKKDLEVIERSYDEIIRKGDNTWNI